MSTSDPFATLGVPRRFSLDASQLEQRFRDLSRTMHPDRHAQASPAERRVAAERSVQLNEAFRLLKDPQARAAALLAAVGRTVDEHARADQGLLLEMLDLREELEHARTAPDRDTIILGLRGTVEEHVEEAERAIADTFDRDTAPEPAQIDRAYAALVKLRYLYRFLEEADAMLEDSAGQG